MQKLGIQGKITPEYLAAYKQNKSGFVNGNRVGGNDPVGDPLTQQNLGMYGGNTGDYNTTLNTTGGNVNNAATPPANVPTGQGNGTGTGSTMYDVRNTDFTSGKGTYKTLADLGIDNKPVVDPYTMGLVNAGVQKGQLYDIVTNEGYNTELGNRVGVMEGGARGAAEANLNVALTAAEKQMQKAGKYSSSATTRAMVGTGEVYAANLANTIAQGTLTIYDQLDKARDSELNRILTSGVTMTEAETSRWNTYVSATIENEKLRVTDETNRAISDMQANLADNIAKIEANTTLTGYEKDIEKQRVQNEFQKGENVLNREHELKLADLDYKAKTYATDIQKEIANIYTGSSEKIKGWELTEVQNDRILQSTQFDILNVDSKTGQPKWMRELELAELTQSQTLELAKDRLDNEKYQFRITTAEGKKQYEENMAWMKKTWGDEQAFNQWKAGLDYDITLKNLENNKLATENDRNNFKENLTFLREQKTDDNIFRQQSFELSRQVAQAQIRDTDFDNAESMRQFNANLEFMKTQGAMNDTLQRDLQSQALSEQRHQFGITRADGLDQWSKTFGESIRQFNLTSSQQYELTKEQLDLAREELTGTQEGRELEQILAVFNNPQVQSFMKTDDPEAAAQFVEDLLNFAASGDVDFTKALEELNDVDVVEGKVKGKNVAEWITANSKF